MTEISVKQINTSPFTFFKTRSLSNVRYAVSRTTVVSWQGCELVMWNYLLYRYLVISWRSGYCDLNKGECDLNQSKDDYFVKRVAKNNN